MSWNNYTLGDMIGGLTDTLTERLDDLNSQLSKLGDTVNSITSTVSDIADKITGMSTQLDASLEAGYSFIALEPEQGDWYTRLSTATNAPSLSTNLYSAIFCNVIVDSTSEAVTTGYNEIVNTFTENFDIKTDVNEIKLGNVTLPTPDDLVDLLPDLSEIPNPFVELVGDWNSTSLAGIFRANTDSVINNINEQIDLKNKVNKALAVINEKKDSATNLISTVSDKLDALSNTGVYTFIGLPATGTTWGDRLTAADSNLPARNASDYCAITCLIVQASDLTELTEKFSKVTDMLDTSIL